MTRCLLLLIACPIVWGGWDSVVEVDKAIFASCNRVRKVEGGDDVSQPGWAGMDTFSPEALWWLGDVVYPARHGDLADLRDAYEEQLNVVRYTELVKKLKVVDGTWDDHDYGVNDGGKDSYTKAERDTAQGLFLDFLGIPSDSPRRSRHGVYSSHRIQSKTYPSKSIALIFLDTRSHRDPYAVPSIGGWNFPFSALFAAVTRTVTSFFNISSEGDVLGEAQWEWLHEIVTSQQDEVSGFIVVSSIQVNTSMPTVESWGHFPESRRRLYEMFNHSKSVLFISGDVHFAEVGQHELTTSGLTHTCATPLYGPLCSFALNAWTAHRASRADFVTSKNYLTLSINWAADTLLFTIRDVNNRPLLYKDLPLNEPTILHDTPTFTLAPDERVLFLCVTGTLLAIAGFLLITPHI